MKIKRTVSLFIAIIFIFASFGVFAQTDYATRGKVADMLMEAADFYNPALVRSDIIKGYEDGQLHEDWGVSRAEALVMLSRAFGKLPAPVGHNARVALTAQDFSDIPQWAEGELKNVFDSGIVAGTAEGIFSPNQGVTRAQMELFISRVYALYATNPKDDFYAAVNKETLEKMQILDGNARAGVLEELQMKSLRQIDNIINDISIKNNPKGSMRQKIADLYNCILDVEDRNKKGIAPIRGYLDEIENVKNISELTILNTKLSKELCVYPFMQFNLTIDLEDSSKYMLLFSSIKPLMNKEVYFEESSRKNAYINYLKTLLLLSGENEECADKNAKMYFAFEKELAESMLSPQEERDINKIFNVKSYSKLCMMFPDFDMKAVLDSSGLLEDNRIIVTDTGLTEKFAQLYNQSNLEVLKIAMKISLLDSCGSMLNEEFVIAEETLNNEILGINGTLAPNQRAVAVLKSVMPEYLGQIYAEEYFDEESKKDVENMVADITGVFKERIDSIAWMGEETKSHAKRKLDLLKVKIGYPDSFETYIDNVDIVSPKHGGTYFQNMTAVTKAAIKYYAMFQNTVPSRDMWTLTPYTVNASYNPAVNDITLPAAILQYPLYDKDSSYEENLGGIGYIIAHEITHAFDANGARFDENGNISNWWSDDDYAAFYLLCQKAVDFFGGYEAIPAVAVNGELTLNENIADLGAASCITQLAGRLKNPDYKLLYESVAKAWVATYSREYAKYAMLVDPHSDNKARVNRVLVNFPEFYEAFDIKETDGMYVPPEERLVIW